MPTLFLQSAVVLLVFLAAPVSAEPGREPAPSANGQQTETYFLPAGDIFKPLIADIRMPRFFISFRQYRYQDRAITISAVGVGQAFGLYRSVDRDAGTAWQVSFGGGLQAQFNLDASSKDLMNADYFVGVPFTYRRGAMSSRVILYHQSSHLGDEYLLHAAPTRMEFSYEALNAVQSYEWREWRGYYGGEVIVRKEPNTLKTLSAQGGIEYHGSTQVWGRGVPIAGLDVKSTQEHDWAINTSVVGGLEFIGSPDRDRSIRVVLEMYKGHNPHGQFYTENTRIQFFGIGVYFAY
ncbi:MAG: DUF1207 domain-containing protein [Nitrospirota bacterium]